jgi:hypothetical protein
MWRELQTSMVKVFACKLQTPRPALNRSLFSSHCAISRLQHASGPPIPPATLRAFGHEDQSALAVHAMNAGLLNSLNAAKRERGLEAPTVSTDARLVAPARSSTNDLRSLSGVVRSCFLKSYVCYVWASCRQTLHVRISCRYNFKNVSCMPDRAGP